MRLVQHDSLVPLHDLLVFSHFRHHWALPHHLRLHLPPLPLHQLQDLHRRCSVLQSPHRLLH